MWVGFRGLDDARRSFLAPGCSTTGTAALLEDAGVPVDAVRYDGLVHGFIDMGAMSPAAGSALADTAARIGKLAAPVASPPWT